MNCSCQSVHICSIEVGYEMRSGDLEYMVKTGVNDCKTTLVWFLVLKKYEYSFFL